MLSPGEPKIQKQPNKRMHLQILGSETVWRDMSGTSQKPHLFFLIVPSSSVAVIVQLHQMLS